MTSTLTVSNLHKRFGSVAAVRGVSFDVRRGEIFGLLGPNGAGKTTTLECVIGLREPDAGEIEVCGVDARKQPAEAKRRIGAALQTTALQDQITPREALALFGSFYAQRADPVELLERFSLLDKADAPFRSLSGGQRQRLALALAFVNRPALLFLDEPTTGLDPQARRDLQGEIARMKREGHTVLLTTHAIDEAEQLCDRIAVVDHGRVIAEGSPAELVARSGAVPTVHLELERPLDPALLVAIPGLRDLEAAATTVRFRTVDVRSTLAEVMKLLQAHSVGVAELHVRRATLEDVFLELTGTRLRD